MCCALCQRLCFCTWNAADALKANVFHVNKIEFKCWDACFFFFFNSLHTLGQGLCTIPISSSVSYIHTFFMTYFLFGLSSKHRSIIKTMIWKNGNLFLWPKVKCQHFKNCKSHLARPNEKKKIQMQENLQKLRKAEWEYILIYGLLPNVATRCRSSSNPITMRIFLKHLKAKFHTAGKHYGLLQYHPRVLFVS